VSDLESIGEHWKSAWDTLEVRAESALNRSIGTIFCLHFARPILFAKLSKLVAHQLGSRAPSSPFLQSQLQIAIWIQFQFQQGETGTETGTETGSKLARNGPESGHNWPACRFFSVAF